MAQWLDLARGLVRPIVTVLVVGVTAGMVIEGRSIPDGWWALVGTVVTFWFASRKTV